MKIIIKSLYIAALACTILAADAGGFEAWLEGVWQEALRLGIDEATLQETLCDIELREDLIEREQQQIRSKITLNEYLEKRDKLFKIIPTYYVRHGDLLNRIGKKYHVQPRFILALWAMESRFGAICGKTPVIPALASLAYKSRRPAFFRKELMAALKMVAEGHVQSTQFVGAWDGGLGQCQFMPTSFWKFAVDEDQDGRRDIFHSTTDVFASIANYLHEHGWEQNATWGREVKLPKKFQANLIDTDVHKSVQQWALLGVKNRDGTPLPKSTQSACLVRKDFTNGRVFLVYKNYHVLKKWNNSTLYAITTGMLADKVSECSVKERKLLS
jgi:membrane-bound lytic murein transglycosylase B